MKGQGPLLTAMSAWTLGAHALLAAPRARVLVLTHLQPPSERGVEQDRSTGRPGTRQEVIKAVRQWWDGEYRPGYI